MQGDIKGPGIALAILGMVLAYVVGFACGLELNIKKLLVVAIFVSIGALVFVEILHRRDHFEARLAAVEKQLQQRKSEDPATPEQS